MRRSIPLSIILVATSTLQVFAGEIVDPSGRFTATVPDGWNILSNPPPQAAFMITKDSGDGTRSVCTAVILATPANTSKTQKDIDDDITHSFTPDSVKAAYLTQGFKDVSVEKISDRQGDGHVVHQMQLTASTPLSNGVSVRLKVFEELHALPRQAHDLGCMTKTEHYDAVAADFVAVGQGYRPRTAIVAQIEQPVATLVTLFADARYQGSRHSVAMDTTDVARVGWTGRTGSLGIEDVTPWQVCEGANFTGRCLVLNASLPGQANHHFQVGSLRRLTLPSSAVLPARTATAEGARAGVGNLLND